VGRGGKGHALTLIPVSLLPLSLELSSARRIGVRGEMGVEDEQRFLEPFQASSELAASPFRFPFALSLCTMGREKTRWCGDRARKNHVAE